MEPSTATLVVSLVVALIALSGALATAFMSRGKDREQQARVALLVPADAFVEAALAALAALRYVTPPSSVQEDGSRHCNEVLLQDRVTRDACLSECAKKIDSVRMVRAQVHLAFHPRSDAAAHAPAVLGSLRACLEGAERFYATHDAAAGDDELLARWNSEQREEARKGACGCGGRRTSTSTRSLRRSLVVL